MNSYIISYIEYTIVFLFLQNINVCACCDCNGIDKRRKLDEIECKKIEKKVIEENKNSVIKKCDEAIEECKEYSYYNNEAYNIKNHLNDIKNKCLSVRDNNHEFDEIFTDLEITINKKIKLEQEGRKNVENFINSNIKFIEEDDFKCLNKGKTFEMAKFIIIQCFFDSRRFYCDNTEENLKIIEESNIVKNHYYSTIIDGNFSICHDYYLKLINKYDYTYTTTFYNPEAKDEKMKKIKCVKYKFKSIDRSVTDNTILNIFEESPVDLEIYTFNFNDIQYFLFNCDLYKKINNEDNKSKVKNIENSIFYITLDKNGNFIENRDFDLKMIEISYDACLIVTCDKFLSNYKVDNK